MDRASGREAIRASEVERLVDGLRRVRAIAVSTGVVVLIWVLSVGPRTGTGVTVGLVVAALVSIIALDVSRLYRPRRLDARGMAIDLFIGAVGQTAVVGITGGIESPFLFVYITIALGAAAALGPSPASRRLLLTALILPWLQVLASHHDLTPRTVPLLLELEPGFAHRLPYAATRAAVVSIGAILMYRLGLLIYRTVNRMLDTALGARREALEAQRERNRELIRLSSAIAHELKNPLASIKGLVQLLQRGGKNETRRFEVLNREIDRTRTILDEFLDFARPLGDLTTEQVQLSALLEDLGTLHEGLAEDAKVRIAPPPPSSLVVRADPRKLAQALVNLLQNAIEASPEGAAVEWVLCEDGERYDVGVIDHGPGMDEAVRSRATQIGATTKPKGSGIGLAVARTIAEQHGGGLVIRNPPGGGCVVCLRLPKAPALEKENDT